MAQPHYRRYTVIAAAVSYGLSIIFLLLVIVGNLSKSQPALMQIYFFRLDLSDIIPLSVTNAQFLNSIARSLGLHDWYQTGLFCYCEGYRDEGITDCSTPTRFYWFNPVQILMSELLAGATIALPSEVNTILSLLELGQQTMFGLFLTSLVVNTILLLATPLALRSRVWSLPISIIACISGLLLTSASALATIMVFGAKWALTQQTALNIKVDAGVPMFAFMWTAVALTDVAFLLHAFMGCFCYMKREKTDENEEGAARSVPTPDEKKKNPMSYFRRRKGISGSE